MHRLASPKDLAMRNHTAGIYLSLPAIILGEGGDREGVRNEVGYRDSLTINDRGKRLNKIEQCLFSFNFRDMIHMFLNCPCKCKKACKPILVYHNAYSIYQYVKVLLPFCYIYI